MRPIKKGPDAMSRKQQISTREFVWDIRSGMTDSQLLEKYKLSPNRLQRIFKGLIDGQIMTTDELAGRYALFDDTVQHDIQSVRLLFRHAVDFVLQIYEEEKPETLGIVLDITEGGVGLKGIEAIVGEFKNFVIPANKFFDMARVEFRARCRWVNREESTGQCVDGFEITSISPGALVELRKLVELIELANQVEVIEDDEPSPEQKRTIKGKDIITDIRSGMTISQLIAKYRFSLKALRAVFRKLLDAGALTKEELDTQKELYRDTVDLKGVRKWLRIPTAFPLRIYDSGNPFATGYVRDISEKGVCVEGIEATVGETKSFIVRSGAIGSGHAFVFEAKCRWVNTEESSGKKWVAGFEITSISSLDSKELRKLIRITILKRGMVFSLRD
jgi:Mor family transcriptional regulator